MIENLIHHIEAKGYSVTVLPDMLLIRKTVHEQVFGIDWAISRHDLDPALMPALYQEADWRCRMLEAAIEREHTRVL